MTHETLAEEMARRICDAPPIGSSIGCCGKPVVQLVTYLDGWTSARCEAHQVVKSIFTEQVES